MINNFFNVKYFELNDRGQQIGLFLVLKYQTLYWSLLVAF